MPPNLNDPQDVVDLDPEVIFVPTLASGEAVDAHEAEVETAGQEATQWQAHMADPARRRAMVPWVLVGAVMLLLCTVALGLSYTSLFSAKVISVTGQGHLDRVQVLRIAGLGSGTNLLHADLASAERRLEQDPWVADATVTRRLPGTLTIVVRERIPVAIAQGGPKASAYVSVEGTSMGDAPAGASLPMIISSDGAAAPQAEDLITGAAVAAAMPRALRALTATIAVDPNGEITVVTRGGVVVTYGEATQLEAKGQSLKAVLGWAEREAEPITSVDVTVPGAPTAALPGGALVTR